MIFFLNYLRVININTYKHLRIVFYFYCVSIIALVILPINNATELNNVFILQIRGDYFLHILMFIPWFFFVRVFMMNALLWFLIGVAFSSTSESLQYFLPYRAFNINDLLANGMGVLLGSFFYLIFALFNKTRVP